MKTTDDPKKVLKALLAKEALPFDAAAADAARALAQAPETATREAVEALPEPLALAVLEATVRAKRVELAAALQESPVKALAKGARRALYGLRSAGVAVPERPKAPAPEPAPAAAEEDEDEFEWLPCWLSPPTGTGERGLLAVRPQKGGLEVAQVVVSDEKGITSIQVAEANRSSYRKQVRELRSEDPIRALEIALEECKAILGEAAAVNLATGSAFPPGTEQLLRHFGISPTKPPEDLPAPLPDDERLATQAASLHQQPEAQGWLPPEEQLKLLAQRIEVVMTSPLQLTPVQKKEQLEGVIRSSAAELFTPAVRKIYARRLWYLGDFLERTARNDEAAVARAEARRMFHDVAPRPDRWEEMLFEKVLALSQALQRGEQLPEPGGAPAPQQGQAEGAAQPGERKSPGGLILP